MPLISVIIPVFNSEKTIKETVESVLSQTISDFELIIINDGSTDATLEVIRRFQDPRLKVFSYPNSGVSVSRNRGISHASGQYIALLDADDLWTSDKLELQLLALKSNPHAYVAYSWTHYIDEEGQFLRRGSYACHSGDVYEQLFVMCFLENGSNPLIRSDALPEVGEFKPSLSPAEDWDFYLRLAYRFQFVCVPAPQVLYRVSKNSASANIIKMERAGLEVLDQAFNRTPERLGHLRKESWLVFYVYLVSRCFEVIPEWQEVKTTIQFLMYDSQTNSLLTSKVGVGGMLKIWFIILRCLHPSKLAIISMLPVLFKTVANPILSQLNFANGSRHVSNQIEQ